MRPHYLLGCMQKYCVVFLHYVIHILRMSLQLSSGQRQQTRPWSDTLSTALCPQQHPPTLHSLQHPSSGDVRISLFA